MKIFFIHPLRNVSENYLEGVMAEVKRLESEGHDVYVPYRDTDQSDSFGHRICSDNLRAMKDADIVYVAWDGESQGCLFDLGMAFALNKPIRAVIGYMPRMSNGKSFQNMIYAWEEKT